MKVNFENIDAYLKANKSDNACGHAPKNIEKSDFQKIGNLFDNSIGSLSHLSVLSSNKKELLTGTYPLQDCLVLECKKCKQVAFFHFIHGGIIPRPEYILADYSLNYLIDPAVKSIRLTLDQYNVFIEKFNLQEQDLKKNEGFDPIITIPDLTKTYLFNYREHDEPNGITAQVDLVGNREFIRKVKKWRYSILKKNA